ncbi:MAG: M28 family peptidase [Planctomycetota bacterium]
MLSPALRFAVLVLLLTASIGRADDAILFDREFDLIRPQFDGDRALGIVADLEPHWRWPGNAGFNATIDRVVEDLQAAGYVEESAADTDDRLTYRVESYPMRSATWDPIDASMTIVGDDAPLLQFASNQNMIVIHSASTLQGGVTAPLIDVGAGRPADFEGIDVEGCIVMGTRSPFRLVREAVMKRGAVGVLCFSMPDYNQPSVYQDSITFHQIAPDPSGDAWAISLSYRAYTTLQQRLAEGDVSLHVHIETKRYTAEERVVIAEVRGATHADQRFVFSAHVQEPGANDNASGIAAQLEMARVHADLLANRAIDPARTTTYLWGNEIGAIARYLRQDEARTKNVRWGMSLDMVGEDTEKTGGTFLIEKMPDPSAVWTRGDDEHTEWGGRPISMEMVTPHYFNHLIEFVCRRQGEYANWIVKTNPYEGGSDHVPFLRAGKPGVLLWHFTDVYYHTDRDRLEMVSADTMTNVGTCALAIAMLLTEPPANIVEDALNLVETSAQNRLSTEARLSTRAIGDGATVDDEMAILDAWTDWFVGSALAVEDVPLEPTGDTMTRIQSAASTMRALGEQFKAAMRVAP